MHTPELIRSTITAYLDRIAESSAAGIVDLYAENATVEDPVGSPVRTGRDEILPLYAGLAASRNSTELLTCGLRATKRRSTSVSPPRWTVPPTSSNRSMS